MRLVERNLGVPDMRFYACVGGGGVVVGWVTVPARATLMRLWGGGCRAKAAEFMLFLSSHLGLSLSVSFSRVGDIPSVTVANCWGCYCSFGVIYWE